MTGIYKITNMVNGKVYIGQAKDIEHRWVEHKSNCKTKNYVLYRAMRKYGFENFSFEILMECEEELLNLMEIYYIKKYNSYINWENSNGYNETVGGDKGVKGLRHTKESKKKMSENKKGEKNSFYGKHHTEETKHQISERAKGRHHTEETKEKLREIHKGLQVGEKHGMWGKHHTDDAKKKISKKMKGRIFSEEHKKKIGEKSKLRTGEKSSMWGKHLSEEHKKKISEANKGGNNSTSKKVFCENMIFLCIKECADYYNKNYSTMKNWLLGRRKMPQEFQNLGLRYATEEDVNTYPIYDKNIK